MSFEVLQWIEMILSPLPCITDSVYYELDG